MIIFININSSDLMPIYNYKVLWFSSNSMCRNKIVKKLAIMDDILNDAVDHLNSIFSIQMIPVILLCLIAQSFATYLMILFFSTKIELRFLGILFSQMLSIHLTVPIVIAIYFGSEVTANVRIE